MYAVIRTGGKQYRVAEGERLDVERTGAANGSELTLTPVLFVDGDTVLSTPDALADVSVSARVVGEAKGPKVIGFKYKNKSRSRVRWGHRQHYDTVEITSINVGGPGDQRSRDDDDVRDDTASGAGEEE